MDSIIVLTRAQLDEVIHHAARVAADAVLATMPKHDQPRPHHVTQTQAAQILELSPTTVGKMVRSGTLKLNACGLVPINEIDRVLGLSKKDYA
jgi:hypothetical protein